MLGIVGSGREPSASQASDALEALQDMANSMIPVRGGPWIEQEVTEDSTAEENDRIRVNSETPITITIPISVTGVEREVGQCGCVTIVSRCTNERAPKDGAKVFITDVYGSITPQMYAYRADSAEWVLASALTLDGPCPWGVQAKEGIAASLALRLAVEFDVEPSRLIVAAAARGNLLLLERFDTPRSTTPAEYF